MSCECLSVEHSVVYRRAGHFAAWPANYGLWIWGDEALVVFADGKLGRQGKLHARDKEHDFAPCQSRSIDGGITWTVERFEGHVPGGNSLSADEHVIEPLRSGPRIEHIAFGPPPSSIDFKDPECIVMAARTGLNKDARSWFYLSRDRARSWEGPYGFEGLSVPGLASRTDIVPITSSHALFMMSCTKPDGQEGRSICVETTDGGRSFSHKSDFPYDKASYTIMPSSVRLQDHSILTVVRCGRAIDTDGWLEAYKSHDLGGTWHFLGRPVENTGQGGNPPSLTSQDGRISLVYGSRIEPFGVRMKISADDGATWSEDLVIRSDAKLPDVGYPRSAARADGSLLTELAREI